MSLFGTASRSSNKNIVQFRAGKMSLKGTTVTADKRKGQVYVHQSDDSLIHFCWKDRTTGNVEDDLIIFPDDCELKRVSQCNTGRVYILKFKSSNRKMFFWMQEPKTDKDEEFCKKVNDALNNPPQPGQSSSSDLGGLDAMRQGGLEDLFSNVDQQQLLQLMAAGAGGGLGSLLNSSRLPSQRNRNSSSRNTSAPRSESTPTPVSTAGSTTTTTASQQQQQQQQQQPAVQLSQLQDILSQMGVPASQAKSNSVDLSEAITPDVMIPILADPKVQERLKPFLPQGESLSSTADELRETIHSPSFRQAMSSFSSALASGQLGPLLAQFGLPEEAQTAAGKGDVEAFAKAMQDDAKKNEEKKNNMNVD